MEVKEVVDKAVEYINHIYGDATSGLMLEEIQRSDDNRKWLITLSFTRKKPQSPSIAAFISVSALEQFERVYKQIQIDAESGEFLGMTIRQV